MAREETIKVIIEHNDADRALSTLDQAAQLLRQSLGSIRIGDTAAQFNNQAQSAQQATQAIQRDTAAIQQNTQYTSHNSQVVHQNTEYTHLNTQAAYQNMQVMQQGAAAVQQNTQYTYHNSQVAHQNTEYTHLNTQAVQQNTQAIQQGAASIQASVQALQNGIAAQRQHAQQQQQNAQAARNHETVLRRLGQQIQGLNALYPANIQYMRQQIQAQNGLNDAHVTATGRIRVLGQDYQTYRASVQAANGVTQNYRFSVNTLTGDVYQLDQGIRSTTFSLTDLSVVFRAIRTVVGFTGIAQTFRSAFTEMKNMSDAMAEYRKVTGATAQEMETLRDSAYEVAKAYGESASDVIASAANMARAGYKENSMAMAELATKTKLVGDMTQEAADKFLIAVDAAYKYNGSVEQLSAVLDAANTIDNNYATTIEKISDGMTLVASLASTAHVPVEQLMAALGTMTAVTQRSGAETARGLRSIILNVIGDTSTEIEEGVTATEKSVKSLSDALNVYAKDVVDAANKSGKIINPMEAIVALQKAWKDNLIKESDLVQLSKDVAGQRYYNVFTALIQNPEMYNDMLQSISESMGSAQNEIDILMDSWSKKLERLKTTWTQLVNQSISEGFIKDLISGATAALEFAGSLGNLATMAAGALVAIRALSAGIGNMRTGAMFGAFNIGTGLLGLGIAGFGALKAAYEKNIRDMQEAATQSVASAIEQSSGVKTLENLVKRYSEIASDGIQTEQGELEELKTLQDELNGLVGDQATAIDLVNGKYGVTITQLQKLTAEQRAAAENSLRSSLSEAVAAFNSSDLNGFFKTSLDDIGQWEDGQYRRFSMTGIGIDAYANEIVQEYLDTLKYLRVFNTLGGNTLFFDKPDNAEEIVAFYKEVQDFYTFLGSTTATGEKATKDAKSMGEEYSAMYSALGNFIKTIQDAGADDIESALEALDTLYQDLDEIGSRGGAADGASKGINKVAESAYTLADAIDAATSSKKKFDDAMKTSKADALNGYISAFQTLKGEIDAGRVNSTAFYASARMLLGDEVYNATGGNSEAVMAALAKRGASGSVYEAGQLLTQTYYDQKGNEVEGWGLYELLSRTKGFEGKLTSADGTAYIPDLTDADLAAISKAWGGLAKEVILSAFDAFDQYDAKGEATEKAVKAVQEARDQGGASSGGETQKTAPELPERVVENQKKLAEAEAQLAEEAEKAAETVTEATEEIAAAADAAEEAKPVTPDTEQARLDAEDWLAILDEIEAAYIRISEMSVGANPELETLIADVEKLRGTITLNIQSGPGSVTSALMAASIANSITTINSYAKDGKIPVTVASKLTGDLNKDLISIIENASTIGELKAIELALTANDKPLDEGIADAIAKKRETLPIHVTAKTEQADKDITKVAEEKRIAYIQAQIAGAKAANTELDNIAKPRTAVIRVKTEESGGVPSGTTLTDSGGGSSSGWSYTTTGGGTAGDSPLYSILDAVGLPVTRKAAGTRSHPGGISLVNDGSGPELIVDRGRAFIAGGGKPAIVSLEKGAKVFTASETRQIFNGSGIPAYAKGTLPGLPQMVDFSGDLGGGSAQTVVYSVTGGGIDSGIDAGTITITKPEGGKTEGSGGSGSGQTEKKTYKFEDLEEAIDYIIERVGKGLDEQLEILDKQIEALKLEKEKAEQENELEKKRKDLADAENNRVVRYIDENGQWHWMADQNKVQKARESLTEYEEELAFNEKIEALQAQKTALQDEYNEITKAWSDILYAMKTPTGDIDQILSDILSSGSATEKKGAETVRDLLISTLLKGGIYGGNYEEALESIRLAAEGSPIMPGESEATLSSLIATTTADGTGTEATNAMKLASLGVSTGGSYFGVNSGGSQTNYNYFINGMQLSEEQTNQPLSSIMRELTVYTNTGVA